MYLPGTILSLFDNSGRESGGVVRRRCVKIKPDGGIAKDETVDSGVFLSCVVPV
jgi:hypothetical protein